MPVPHGHRPSRRRRVEQAAQVKGVQLDASAAVRRHLRDTAAVSVEQALTVLWQESACSVLTHKDPKSVKQARARPDSQQWQDAMLKEWAGLWKKEAFAKVKKTGQKLHHMICGCSSAKETAHTRQGCALMAAGKTLPLTRISRAPR